MLKVGDQVRSLQVKLEDNSEISFPELGKKYVLFFYPKDNTPGCTAEVCSFRDAYSELKSKGYTIIGCSPDSGSKHLKFIENQSLPYSLISDEDKSLIQLFEVWGQKKFMGKTYDGVYRTTFIIDEKSSITHVIDQVKTKEAAQQVLDLLN